MPSAYGLDVYLTHHVTPYAEHQVLPDPAATISPHDLPAHRAIVRRRLSGQHNEVARVRLRAGPDFKMHAATALHVCVVFGKMKLMTIWDEVLVGDEIEQVRDQGFALLGRGRLPEVMDRREVYEAWCTDGEPEMGVLTVTVVRGRSSGKGFSKKWTVDREEGKLVTEGRKAWLKDADFKRLWGVSGGAMEFWIQIRGWDFDLARLSRSAPETVDEYVTRLNREGYLGPPPMPLASDKDTGPPKKECPQKVVTPLQSCLTTAPVRGDKSQASATPEHRLDPVGAWIALTNLGRQPSAPAAEGINTAGHPESAGTSPNTDCSLTGYNSKLVSKGSYLNSSAIGDADAAAFHRETAIIRPVGSEAMKRTGAGTPTAEILKQHSCLGGFQSPTRATLAQFAKPADQGSPPNIAYYYTKERGVFKSESSPESFSDGDDSNIDERGLEADTSEGSEAETRPQNDDSPSTAAPTVKTAEPILCDPDTGNDPGNDTMGRVVERETDLETSGSVIPGIRRGAVAAKQVDTPLVQCRPSGLQASVFVDLTQPTAKEVLAELRKAATDSAERANTLQRQHNVVEVMDPRTTVPTQLPSTTVQPPISTTTCERSEAEPTRVTRTVTSPSPLSNASALGKRKASVIEEDAEDEEELRDQLKEIELQERKIEVGRRLRDLKRKKRVVGEV
ncbi:hypothetical protein LTR02_005799 [Friedmanniomyces endolithicus]|nr:hypothetical protein LTR02_005799 [Friedmanniomyces endolithicus]